MKYTIRKVFPVLVFAALGAAACEDKDTTGPTETTDVRFVNAIADASGNLILTANNNAVGSSLGFGQFSSQCVAVNSGNAINLAFGTANTGGTGIASTLGTATANFTSGGDFTVIAAGTAANPQLFVINNATTTPTGSNAALRFLSAIQGSDAFDVFLSSDGTTLTTPIASNLTFGATGSGFVTVPAGTGTLVFTEAGTTDIAFTVPSSMTLTAGQVRTVLLAPDAEGTGFSTVTLAGC